LIPYIILEGGIMKRISGLLILLLATSFLFIHADRASIPFKSHVKVFEPNQRAMIAWNGQEEILLLTTDLKASEPTRVLEVIPLPSEPMVKKGDMMIFRKATALINSKIRRGFGVGAARTKGVKKGVTQLPAGEVAFHERIGAHDISVTHVLRGDGFIEWVDNYLEANGVENPVIPEALKEVIEEYIKDEFTWFVFDVVSLDTEPKTNEAIQYRFKTDFLFYPVKITRTEEGYTSINLIILTPWLLVEFPGIPLHHIRQLHEPVKITSSELRNLSVEMDELMEHRQYMVLRIWEIRGKLSEFTKDVIAK
jgi:hypothetical protein